MRLANKVAIITGAATGIGNGIADVFASEGAAVVIDYVSGQDSDARTATEKIRSRGGKALAVEADVTSTDQVNAMIDKTVSEFGKLDIFVNNAGIEQSQPLLEVDEASWDRTLAVDLKGPFLCLQAAARRMQETGGSIVNISSIHEDIPFPGFTPYAAAKGGLRMLMRNASLELAVYGIRVNNIAPGAIATPINAATFADPAKMQRLQEIVPLQRVGKPEEVAQVALFLASDRSSYVTGSTYFVDGGMVRHAESL